MFEGADYYYYYYYYYHNHHRNHHIGMYEIQDKSISSISIVETCRLLQTSNLLCIAYKTGATAGLLTSRDTGKET